MQAMQAVTHAAQYAGVSARQVGRRMGKGENYVSRIIGRGSTPNTDSLCRMLGVCGFGLYAIPDGEQIPETALRIDAKTGEGKDTLPDTAIRLTN